MKNICFITFIIFMFSCICSCDDGRIFDKAVIASEEGSTVKMVGKISGLDSWTGDYSVVVAGFDDKSEYAITSANILMSAVDNDGNVTVVMSGIKDNVTKLELCVINRIRERVVTFTEMPVPEQHNDTIRMDVGSQDVSMFSAVQKNVFNSNCIACHGAASSAAAGLLLTENNSYDVIVGKASHIDASKNIVEVGNSKESFLHIVLNENGHVRHDHEDILSSKSVLLYLVDDWIDGGAKQ